MISTELCVTHEHLQCLQTAISLKEPEGQQSQLVLCPAGLNFIKLSSLLPAEPVNFDIIFTAL